jgi:hypothetical protein
MFYYYQKVGGEEHWSAVPASQLPKIVEQHNPMFVTVLAVNKLADDLPAAERDKLAYEGPFYVDWDGPKIEVVIDKVHAFMDKLQALGVDLSMARWYATGAKGFHMELPCACFMEKPPKGGTPNLPLIYKEMVFHGSLYVDHIDLRVYTQGRGRQWRRPNVLRENGRYKVQLTVEEVRNLTVESYEQLTSSPRELFEVTAPALNAEMSIAFARAQQKVEGVMKERKSRKVDPMAKEKAKSVSIQMMMAGLGIKEGVGFHQLALQIGIIANTAGMTEDELLQACAGLVENHQGDGDRYNTPWKRKEEILRMFRYCTDNPMYEFRIGAVKVLLSHASPDLDGLLVTEEDIKEEIETVAAQQQTVNPDGTIDITPDEFADVAGGVTLSKFGVYVASEDGNKRRVCALSFRDIHLLLSMDTGQIAAYEAEVLVNGRGAGRITIEMDTFQSLQSYNRFCQRFGHQMQGSETHLRGMFMRFIELAKKKGRAMYIAKREGLDLVNIPNHEDPDLREPFMVWADGRGVILDPRVANKKELDVSFQGFPDPRGLFKTDIGDAPKLQDLITDPAQKQALQEMLRNMMTCQKPDVISKLIGWYTACFYRMIFHRAYSKFPLLHVNGAAGAGKTEMNKTMAAMFFYNQEPKMLTPGSTVFAISQHMSGSTSIPLIVDEYKPHEMHKDTHDKLKLLFRDAYNARDQQKGGGNRESDDYRVLSHTQLASPLVFIAEAPEEESAVAERVVLVTVVKPSTTLSLKWLARYQAWDRSRKLLTSIGKFLAAEAIHTSGVDNLRKEFDPLFEAARNKFMLTEDDLKRGLSEAELAEKQGAKERSVFNFTVARYGLMKFRNLIDTIFGVDEFRELFTELEEHIYDRMVDLQPATQAEWAKVMDTLATMTYSVEPDSPYALVRDRQYHVGTYKGHNVVEIAIQDCYLRYRAYMRQTGSRALYTGVQSFMQSIKDCPALLHHGHGELLDRPGVYTFDTDELVKMKVSQFK